MQSGVNITVKERNRLLTEVDKFAFKKSVEEFRFIKLLLLLT